MLDSSAHLAKALVVFEILSFFGPPTPPSAASPMAPCCKFLITFHCWQTHGLFIQNILVSWILNSLKVPGSGSVMSHCFSILSTKLMTEGLLTSVFAE